MSVLGQSGWVLFFAVVGVFALAAVVVGLFFSLGRRPSRLEAVARPPVGSDEFLQAAAALVNGTVLEGGSARILNNGVEFFPALDEAIRGARHSVNFMSYIWEPGAASRMVTEALVAAARAGVQVRVLQDGVGGIRAPRDELERIREAGGKIEVFRPPVFGMLTRIHRRNHRRAIVVDGRVGFTGGIAVGDAWLGDARNPGEWRDFMVRLEGPLAANLQSAFAELWANTCGEILVGPAFYPEPGAALPDGGEEVEPIRHVSVISSPSSEEHPVRLFFMIAFESARERLWITTAYFVPDASIRRALRARAREGVDVRILLPSEITDATPIRQASHFFYDELLSDGVRIFEYQPTMMHAKSVVVDGVWSIIGSANLDIRSKELNEENLIGIRDVRFARELERVFLADLERAREIRLEEWRRRGPWPRFKETLAWLFAEQY